MGNFLWEQNYGGDLRDGLSFINATADNGLLFGLSSDSYGINGGRAGVIIKTDSLGEIEWQEVVYPEINAGPAYIHPLADGSYIFRGQKGAPVDT